MHIHVPHVVASLAFGAPIQRAARLGDFWAAKVVVWNRRRGIRCVRRRERGNEIQRIRAAVAVAPAAPNVKHVV